VGSEWRALVDSPKLRLRAITLRRRASGIRGAVTANGRNDLYRHWHFPVRIERRFYYGILATAVHQSPEKSVRNVSGRRPRSRIKSPMVPPFPKQGGSPSIETPSSPSIDTRAFPFPFSFPFSSARPDRAADERNLVGVPEVSRRIDCFSYGGENTLCINERPARPKTRLTTRRYLWP
jgi:hypothetical protein